MRTIRCVMNTKVDATNELRIETEIIIDNDADARDAGHEAYAVILAFREGIVAAADESES